MPYVTFSPAFHPFAAPAPQRQQRESAHDPLLDIFSAVFGPEPTKQEEQKKAAPQIKRQAPCAPRHCAPRQPVFKRVINPNFDVSEFPQHYVLEGELAGVSDKSTIEISFDDAQTIVVRGEVKRETRNPSAVAEPATAVAAPEPTPEAQLQAEEKADEVSETASTKGHSVYVEDVQDESETASNDDFEVVEDESTTAKKANKGKGKAAESADVEMTEDPATSVPEESKKPEQPRPRYWIAERSAGVFERKFNFQGLIDQEGVKASLENGLLTIVVPKRENYVRQVFIQ